MFRFMKLLSVTCMLVCTVHAQYATSIVAGGGPPNGATGTNIALFRVTGLVADGSGGFYFASGPQNRVFRVAANGTVTTIAGKATKGYSGDNGAAVNAQLNNPSGLGSDNAGNLYIADTGNFRVRKVSGGTISTVAGSGMAGFSGDGGPATSAQLSSVNSLAVDASGNVYIADGSRVRKIAGGVISTFAGTGAYGYSGDGGPAVNAQIGYASGLAVDGSGNVYIADSNTRVRKVTAGVITTVAGNGQYGYSGDGGPATSAQISVIGLAADSAGNLYLADSSTARVRKVAGGVITTIAGNGTYGFSGDGGPATSAQVASAEGLTVDSAGTLYIADNGNYRIRKVAAGVISTVAGNGTYGYSGDGAPATSAQVNPGALTIDNTGNLYISDTLDYRIRKVTAGTITTAAGNGTPGYSGDGGPAVNAQIGYSTEVTSDGAGNLYISDRNSGRIRKVTGGVITTIAGSGTFGYSGDGGPAASARFAALGPIVSDSAGTLYVADHDRIRKISGGTITLVAGRGPADGATATAVSIQPSATAADPAGNVYVAATGQHRVFKIAANGTITTVAGTGTAGFSGDGGPAASAQLYLPQTVALDASGAIYIADYYAIRRVAGGMISTVAGGGSGCVQQTNPNGDGCPATSVSLTSATGLAIDSAGNLYIGDPNGARIRKVSGGIISTVVGNGMPGFAGDGGPATAGSIGRTTSLAVDSAGNLFIADTENNRVRKVSGGIITTIAGTGTPGYFGDGGSATNAQLNAPRAVAVDSAGSVYIVDSSNSRIRKVSGGVITTAAGTGMFGFSGDGGMAINAELGYASGIAVSNGTFYIADTSNYRVRKVSSGMISTLAGNGWSSYSGDGGPALDAQIGYPQALAVDNQGTVYLSDSASGRVRAISSTGTISTFAGGGNQDGGLATSVALSPRRIAVDGARNVFIEDRSTQYVRKVSGGMISSITPITTTAGMGSYPFPGDGGGMAADTAGSLYISSSDGTVRRLTPTTQPCSYSLDTASPLSMPATGGSVTVNVSTLAGCTWQTTVQDFWVGVMTPSFGADSGSVILNVFPNADPVARSSKVSIGGQTLTINQAAGGCLFSALPSSIAAPASGQISNVTLTVFGPGTCSWTARSSDSWAEVYPLSGNGSGTLIITIYPKFGTQQRTATITVGSQTVTITQSGMAGEQDLRFVRRAYFNALRRLPSAAEEQFHWNRLKTGASRASVMQGFLEGGEFKTGGGFVTGLYLILLGRKAERGGWAFQLNSVVINGTPQAALAGNFLNSAEWQLKQGGTITDAAFITLLYKEVLGRTPSAAERDWQLGNLAKSSRAQMATNFISGAEFYLNKASILNALHAYFVILGRDPTAQEFTEMEAQIRGGRPFSDVINAFVNSPEHALALE